jgi:small subunit ribosomal protein S1
VRVKILEIDSERRRLSLSIKRVEGQVLPSEIRAREAGLPAPGSVPAEPEGAGDLDDVPSLGLSEDVFAGEGATATEAGAADETVDEADAAMEEAGLPVEAAGDAAEAPQAEAAEAPQAEAAEAPQAEAEVPQAEAPQADAKAAPDVDPAPEAEAPAEAVAEAERES